MKNIDSTSVPRLLPGVRLRSLDDGARVLLVPEGAVTLSTTGAAVVEAIDGKRDISAIVALMGERFDAAGADLTADVAALLEQFAQHSWIELSR